MFEPILFSMLEKSYQQKASKAWRNVVVKASYLFGRLTWLVKVLESEKTVDWVAVCGTEWEEEKVDAVLRVKEEADSVHNAVTNVIEMTKDWIIKIVEYDLSLVNFPTILSGLYKLLCYFCSVKKKGEKLLTQLIVSADVVYLVKSNEQMQRHIETTQNVIVNEIMALKENSPDVLSRDLFQAIKTFKSWLDTKKTIEELVIILKAKGDIELIQTLVLQVSDSALLAEWVSKLSLSKSHVTPSSHVT
jgi:hypothetical protein